MAAWGVKRVLVSPLSRTIQTASLAFQHEHHIPMEVCVDAIEYFPWLKESVGRDAIDLATCDGIQSLHRAQDIVLSSLGTAELPSSALNTSRVEHKSARDRLAILAWLLYCTAISCTTTARHVTSPTLTYRASNHAHQVRTQCAHGPCFIFNSRK